MTMYTITYGRKVQVKPYEMLTIGLEAEFNSDLTGHNEAFSYIRATVDKWIDEERSRLGAS